MKISPPQLIITLVSLVVLALSVYYIVTVLPPQPVPAISSSQTGTSGSSASIQTHFTKAQLATFDGKNGHFCYVAVDRVVYDVSEYAAWAGGTHTVANSPEVMCGKDLSKFIDQAPHGRDIVEELKEVGVLVD